MGPVKDAIRLLRATQEQISHAEPDAPVSDRFHMANIFGLQEYARTRRIENATPALTRNVRIASKCIDWLSWGHL